MLEAQSYQTLSDPMDCTSQAPLSLEFPRQECWSNCHSALQGILLTQGWNPDHLLCRQILYHLNYQVNFDVLSGVNLCIMTYIYKFPLLFYMHCLSEFHSVIAWSCYTQFIQKKTETQRGEGGMSWMGGRYSRANPSAIFIITNC